jgi:peptidyl-prolyl cis-trans isomerase SurA
MLINPNLLHFCLCPALLALSMLAGGCQAAGGKSDDAAPPPDVRRPQLRSQTQLAAERLTRITQGAVQAQDPPALDSTGQPRSETQRPPPTPPLDGGRSAIHSDVLLVNDKLLSADEVLYPIRAEIAAARAELTGEALEAEVVRWVQSRLQLEVGTLLVYEKAVSTLNDQQRAQLDQAVERELDAVVAQDFGDSMARFERDLADNGLTLDLVRKRLQRQMVVRSYTREVLLSKVTVRRDELLAYFRDNPERFSEAESRELLMIAAPFAAFLEEGQTWSLAPRAQQLRAKLAAKRHIRAAAAALAGRPFRDVAREQSRGPRASEGGSWGFIGAPLRAPLDEISSKIFDYSTGQKSEPIELEDGWYIVACGAISPGKTYTFMEVQEQVRHGLTEERFEQLASDYIMRLADKATISDLRSFLEATARKALNG